MVGRSPAAFSIFWIASLVACGDSHSAAPETEAGLWGPDLQLVEEMRIGGLTGEESVTFGNVSTLAPAPDGTLYVGDRQVPVIRRYDSDGTYLGDVGGAGEGPGEYLSITNLAVAPDGRLSVWDQRTQRLTFFAPDGTLVDSYPMPGGNGGWRGFVYGLDGQQFMTVIPEGGFSESRDGLELDWAKVEPGGEFRRLTHVPPADREGLDYVLSGRGGLYRPFPTETLSTLGPDGSLYQARNDEYVIERILPSGDTTVITRDQTRVELTPEEHEEWEGRGEWFMQSPRAGFERADFFPIPTTKPFMREFVVDPEGRLWVSRYTEAVFEDYSPEEAAEREAQGLPSFRWRDELTWDVFDPEGQFLGAVTLPRNTSFVVAIGDHVWGVHAGSYREDYVVRWRIERGATTAP